MKQTQQIIQMTNLTLIIMRMLVVNFKDRRQNLEWGFNSVGLVYEMSSD